ncbi:translation initiation factor eIF-2B subunit delta [Phyllosticta capitalensis]
MADAAAPKQEATQATPDTQTKQNGSADTPKAAPESAEPKISGAELKKRAKAEKAAKRAAEKAAREVGGGSAQPAPGKKQDNKQKDTKQGQQQGAKGQQPERPLPVRRRGSQTAPAQPVKETKSEKQKAAEKKVGLFGHLYGQPRRQTIEGAPKDVHPAVLALGLQMSNYVVCGSIARCVAMLSVSKQVIESYTTPPGTSLARHLTSHHLSPQISYLSSCRPLSVSQGNAIRWLKDLIIKIDPSVPESTAKEHLSSSIDTFIRERVTAAAEVLADTACDMIVDDDVIVVYAKSNVVLKTLLRAHAEGRKFRVIVADSKPLFEGKCMANSLTAAGIDVTYCLIGAISLAIKDATKVFLGASAMLSNGRIYSRVGTAIVAMAAHVRDITVIVCCETIKFTDRVALDSIVHNEIAPAEEILGQDEWIGESLVNGEGELQKGREGALQKWMDTPGLQILNIMYDVTPAEYVSMVVTEMGNLPASSVPVVHRASTNA